jgi:hypothetical protein
MQRIATANRDVDKHGAGKDGFDGGDPLEARDGTDLSADWCDAIQEEIANTIEDAGVVLDDGDNGQLSAIVNAKADGAASSTDNEIPRFHLATGKVLQTSGMRVSDAIELEYISAKSRSSILPLTSAIAFDTATGADSTITQQLGGTGIPNAISVPGGSSAFIPVSLRTESFITSIDITADPTTSFSARLVSATPSFAAGTTSTATVGSTVANSGTAIQTRTISAINSSIANGGSQYGVLIDAVGALIIHGVRVNYLDPGPRSD